MTTSDGSAAAPVERVVRVAHPQGLHLRTSNQIVQAAARFVSDIRAGNLSRPSPLVNVKSILQLMQLQAHAGHLLRLTAVGVDAQEAINALALLIDPQSSTSPQRSENPHSSEMHNP